MRLIRVLAGLALLAAFAALPAAADFDVETHERSVVRIIAKTEKGESRGTGFIVTSDGYILTNVHVIAGGKEVKVWVPEKQEFFRPQLVDAAIDLDIALLKIELDDLQAARLSNAERDRGADVFAIGYPGAADRSGSDILNAAPTLTSGIISSEKVAPWAGRGPVKVRMIQHSAIVTEGNSGGPLFDNCGRVIGINTQRSKREGVYWSSAIEEALALLERNEVSVALTDTACARGGGGLSLSAFSGLSPRAMLGAAISLAALAMAGIMLVSMRRRAGPVPASGVVSGGQGADSLRRISSAVGLSPSMSASATLAGLDRDGRPFRLAVPGEQLNRAYGVVVGRDPRLSDAVLEDAQLSRRHARFFRVDGRFFVEDLNSTNGTRIAGAPLEAFEPAPLSHGSQVELAGLTLTISTD